MLILFMNFMLLDNHKFLGCKILGLDVNFVILRYHTYHLQDMINRFCLLKKEEESTNSIENMDPDSVVLRLMEHQYRFFLRDIQ